MTPPLNELLGQREEFNLNEVSGNPGQLASLEQRATELLRLHAEPIPVAVEDGAWFMVREQDALDAITAALSAQPPSEAVAWQWRTSPNGIEWSKWVEWDREDFPRTVSIDGQPHVAQYRPVYATPQPREVRGVDRDAGGRIVRQAWVRWAEAQPNPKPSWLAPYESLSEPDKEADRQIYEAVIASATTPQDAAGVEGMSPDFTDSARAAIAWVLYHHQGGSSPVGQPLRFALGMGADDPLPNWRIAEAKRYAEWAGASTERFHTTPPPGVDVAALRQIAGELRDNAHHHQQEDREVGILADEQEAQFNTELAERIERALTGDAAVWTPEMIADIHQRGEALHARINTPQPGVDLEQFRPAVEALERAGRVSEVKDGQLHWHLNEKHWEAQRLFAIIDAAAPGTGKDSLQVGGAGSGVLP